MLRTLHEVKDVLISVEVGGARDCHTWTPATTDPDLVEKVRSNTVGAMPKIWSQDNATKWGSLVIVEDIDGILMIRRSGLAHPGLAMTRRPKVETSTVSAIDAGMRKSDYGMKTSEKYRNCPEELRQLPEENLVKVPSRYQDSKAQERAYISGYIAGYITGAESGWATGRERAVSIEYIDEGQPTPEKDAAADLGVRLLVAKSATTGEATAAGLKAGYKDGERKGMDYRKAHPESNPEFAAVHSSEIEDASDADGEDSATEMEPAVLEGPGEVFERYGIRILMGEGGYIIDTRAATGPVRFQTGSHGFVLTTSSGSRFKVGAGEDKVYIKAEDVSVEATDVEVKATNANIEATDVDIGKALGTVTVKGGTIQIGDVAGLTSLKIGTGSKAVCVDVAGTPTPSTKIFGE